MYRRRNRNLIQSQKLFPIGRGGGKKPTFPSSPFPRSLHAQHPPLLKRRPSPAWESHYSHKWGRPFRLFGNVLFLLLDCMSSLWSFRYILSWVFCFKAPRGWGEFLATSFKSTTGNFLNALITCITSFPSHYFMSVHIQVPMTHTKL